MNKICLLVGSSCLLFSLIFNFRAEARTFDRLVVEINGKSFGQRQIELYVAVRRIAQGDLAAPVIVEGEAWRTSLDVFQRDMTVYINIENDSEKFDALVIPNAAVAEVQARIEHLHANDVGWQRFFEKYHVRDSEIMRALLQIFKIQVYIGGFAGVGKAGKARPFRLIQIDPRSAWFKNFAHSTPVRLYDRALEYLTIEPYGNLP